MIMAKKSPSRPTPQRPTFDFEREAAARGLSPVAGVDEAGRGPWAGPVVAAAVILDAQALPTGINDSKALDAAARDRSFDAIMASSVAVGIGIADVERIDAMNILAATLWAMQQAVEALAVSPALVIVDGNKAPQLTCDVRTLIKGDALCLSVAAASIVAKVTRDRMMIQLADKCPGYGFENHKGYGTPEHRASLAALGVCDHHRRSFRPIKLALMNASAQTETR